MENPQEQEFVEQKSLGSDCCNFDVIEDDGVIRCVKCKEVCEEVFETADEAQDRFDDEIASIDSDLGEERFEDERNERYCNEE